MSVFRGDKLTVEYYRGVFDSLNRKQIIWEPYSPEIINNVPRFCTEGEDIWRAVVPLISFNIVEWHQPDRVMRQFGLQQPIPKEPKQEDKYHGTSLTGKVNDNWEVMWQNCIETWNQRRCWVVTGTPQRRLLSDNSEYIKWYHEHTRRWISKKGAQQGLIVSF